MPKELVPLTRNLVKPDQPLLVPVFKEDGTLLAQKGIILNESQMQTLDEHEVLYTLSKALEMPPSKTKERMAKEKKRAYHLKNPFERLGELRDELILLFSQSPERRTLDAILEMIGPVQSMCEEAPDVVLATIFIDLQEHYTTQHALHVAIVCELTAKSLGWETEERRSLVGAALTMNISMGLLQDMFMTQAEPLSDKQRRIIRKHPMESAVMLSNMGLADQEWLEYVLKHHESVDGTGYPDGLRHQDIPLGASLLHLADVYCAKVTGRYYREPIYANIAARDVFMIRDKKTNGPIIEFLVKTLGIYPPGCQVVLANGEMGVVIKRGKRLDTPNVKIIMDAKGNRLATPIMRNTINPNYTVKEIVQPNVVRWDPDFMSLWGYARSNSK